MSDSATCLSAGNWGWSGTVRGVNGYGGGDSGLSRPRLAASMPFSGRCRADGSGKPTRSMPHHVGQHIIHQGAVTDLHWDQLAF
ncbi:MAG: hypothetical protein ACRDRE_18675, partial [Pseudonocardiaceae bacterium]